MRIAVIGNAGGGKSRLARMLAVAHDLPYIEIDTLLWRPGWQLVPEAEFAASHTKVLAKPGWVIDGLGRQDFIAPRLEHATHIVLVDMPLWMHFTLAAERQIAWATGKLTHPPAGLEQMPPTASLFETIWNVENDWMPQIRERITHEEKAKKTVLRLGDIDQLTQAQHNVSKGKAVFPS
jgi:adenylate kinase family enzyme